ncbi:MAG TPA: T9SS type A sorting domain-containing protein, partial [Candidatus Kapabacteria bacterium]
IGSEIDTGYIYDVLLTKSGHVVIPLSLKDSPRGALSMLKCDVNGVMDSTFGGNGRGGSQLSDNIEMIYSISETPDQNILCTILLVIQNYYRPLLVQFTKKGSLDASFGDHGVVGSIDSLPTAYFHQCAIDSNGDIIIPGSTYLSDSTYAHCIIRYHKDGRLDSSFGTNGIVICAVTTPSYMPNGIADIAIGNDGKYLMAGILRCTDVGIVAEQGILYRVNNKAVASVYSSSALSQPISQFPSPSTDNCTITYTLPSSSQCTITLRDESGREVRKFATDEYRTAGEHKEELDLRGLASGAYFLQIESNDLIQTAKLIKQ